MDIDLEKYLVDESETSSSDSPRSKTPKTAAITLPLINGKFRIPKSNIEAGSIFQNQQYRELLLISDITSFTKNGIVNLDDITSSNLSRLLENEPFNSDILKILFSSIGNAFTSPRKFDAKRKVVNENLRDISIISSGRYGNIYRVVFKNIDDLFVVKIPRDLSDETKTTNIHEFFIGLQLNKLRDGTSKKVGSASQSASQSCPNFMYVFSLFKCFASFRDIKKVCAKDGIESFYLLSEYVKGQDLEFFLQGTNITDLMCVYYQLLFALHIAYKEFGFTHYDLHTGNTMVYELPEETYIPYSYVNNGTIKKVYIKSRFMVKIIDYGYSTIIYENEPFGYIPAFNRYIRGLNPLNPNPLFDLYKLTGSICHRLLHFNKFDTFEKFWPCLYRFPSIQSATENLDYITPKSVTDVIDQNDENCWQYEAENSSMETENIYLDAINFAVSQIETEKILFKSKEIPKGARNIFSCLQGCTNIETIKQILSAPVPIKRKK